MIKFLEEEGTKICNKIANYSKKWKQPVNFSKTVVQVFHQGGNGVLLYFKYFALLCATLGYFALLYATLSLLQVEYFEVLFNFKFT